MAQALTGGTCYGYGLTSWGSLFTPRQLVALTTFSDLVGEARERVLDDFLETQSSGSRDEAQAYADAVMTYLSLAVDRFVDYWNSLVRWQPVNQQMSNAFSRQALPMMWDFTEANPFSNKNGSFNNLFSWSIQSLHLLPSTVGGQTSHLDATTLTNSVNRPVISTDPPYYDNISYADLSDFFYVWLRRSLEDVYPEIFGTMLVPKSAELVATPYRFGGSKQKAREFFESGLGTAWGRMRERANPDYPVTIYYASKQAESEKSSVSGSGVGGDDHGVLAVASTGWETMLTGLMEAGLQITGTWPVRTEMSHRMVSMGRKRSRLVGCDGLPGA